MKNLRSVSALLAISAAFSCATAINDNVPDNLPQTGAAGADNGGIPEPSGEGGAPAAGSPPASGGDPGSAGKVETGKGGSGTGSGGKGGGMAGSTGKGGSGGTVGMGGAPSTGGKAGTGSSGGAGEGTAGTIGSAGGTGVAPCENAKEVKGGQSGNFNTKEAVCLRTKESFNTVGGCSNWGGRTIKVNGMLATCMVKTAFPAAIDTWNYFDVSAGDSEFATFSWYNM